MTIPTPTQNDLDTTTSAGTVPMSVEQLDRIADLLEITDTFLRANHRRLGDELDDLLVHRGITGGPGWLIDMLGMTALSLRITASAPAADGEQAGEQQ